MFDKGPSEFPSLKGKAAEIRRLAGPLCAAFSRYMNSQDEGHRQIHVALQLVLKIENLMDEHLDYRWPAAVANDFEKATQALVQVSAVLYRRYSADGGMMLFNFVPKHHYLLHIGMAARYISPRLAWCYDGEDFMQKAKTIAQANHKGTPPYLVVPKMMEKYILGFSIGLAEDPWRK